MSVSQQQNQIPLTRHEGTFIVTNGDGDVSSPDFRTDVGKARYTFSDEYIREDSA